MASFCEAPWTYRGWRRRSRFGWTGIACILSHRITWHGEYPLELAHVDDHTTAPGQPGHSA
ncbi:MAG: hypothetical protein M0C28_34610 [Candidatus Moduliflexus flocculans]|nr:hypothetical protein [Candidatus Moduliflexus flocculans]